MKIKENSVETDRLLLIPCEHAHAAALNSINSLPEVMKFLGGKAESLEDTERFIERVIERWKQHGCSWWTIFEKATEDSIGGATLQYLPGDSKGRLEVGWRLAPSAQGKGFATEAGQAAIAFGRRNFAGQQIVAVAHPENSASHRVMERLGMKRIGIEEHYGEDCVVYELPSP